MGYDDDRDFHRELDRRHETFLDDMAAARARRAADGRRALEAARAGNADYAIHLLGGREGLSPAAADPPDPPDDPPSVLAFRRAMTAWRAQDDDAALDALDEAIVYAPGAPALHAWRGKLRRMADDLSGAREDLDRALAAEPDHPRALRERGVLNVWDRRYDDAVADLSAARRPSPDDPDLAYWHGLALAHLDRPADALAAFDMAVTEDPPNGFAHLQRGRAHLELGQRRRALADLMLAADAFDGASDDTRRDRTMAEARELIAGWAELAPTRSGEDGSP